MSKLNLIQGNQGAFSSAFFGKLEMKVYRVSGFFCDL